MIEARIKRLDEGVVREGAFGRFYIFHPDSDRFAWSGARWVSTRDGVPAPPNMTQVCNFTTAAEALIYIDENKKRAAENL